MRVAEAYVEYGKKPTNVSINEGLLREARALDINLSATLEKALEAEVRARRRAQWREDNREAMAAYNARIARHGLAGDRVRAFKASLKDAAGE